LDGEVVVVPGRLLELDPPPPASVVHGDGPGVVDLRWRRPVLVGVRGVRGVRGADAGDADEASFKPLHLRPGVDDGEAFALRGVSLSALLLLVLSLRGFAGEGVAFFFASLMAMSHQDWPCSQSSSLVPILPPFLSFSHTLSLSRSISLPRG
jgi:hypothetical protein